MFPKSKRFQDTVSCAPPVGRYNIDNNSKKSTATALFTKSKRFGESKENLPGPCDTTVSSYLDISTCSNSSKGSTIHYMSTPRQKSQDKAKLQALERTIDSLKQELSLLREQNQALQNKISVEDNVVLKEDKLVATEDDLLLGADFKSPSSPAEEKINIAIGTDDDPDVDLTALLASKEKELANLQMIFRCEQENCKADIDLEKTRNMALKTRITALEKSNQEIACDREQVEDENKKLQGLADELREENFEVMRKLGIVENNLEDATQKLVKTEEEGKESIQRLKAVVEEEIMKANEQEQKYVECIKSSEENFSNAMKMVEDLQNKNVANESRVDELEQRLVKVTEQEQQANEVLGCLRAENLSLESQLTQCQQDYEEKLQLSATQVEKLQEEIQSNQELMVNNFQSLTDKYTALQEIYDTEKADSKKELQILQAILETTKISLRNSNKEHDELISTFDALKNQLAEEQGSIRYLQDIGQDLVEQLFSAQSRTSFLENEFSEVQEAAREKQMTLEDQLNKSQQIIDNLESEHKLQLQNIEILSRIEKSQNEKLSDVLGENESLKNKNDKMVAEVAEVQHEIGRYQQENKNLKIEMQDTKVSLEQKAKEAEERASKIKEEFGRRLVETQKKLSQNEINQTRLKQENTDALKKLEDEIKRLDQKYAQEKEDLETTYERLLQNSQDEIENLREKLNRHNNDAQIEDLKQQIEMWQNKYEELEEKIEPFKEQLDAFEAEKNALLSQNCEAQNEVSKLSAQYAKLLGHQNQKQKIHHVLKLKQENIDLKSENAKLREQCEKQKRSLKRLEEKMDNTAGKKRFNPAEAFSNTKKENRPLTVISHGNVSQHK